MTPQQLHNFRQQTAESKTSSYPAFICKGCGNKCGLLGSRTISGKKLCKRCVDTIKKEDRQL